MEFLFEERHTLYMIEGYLAKEQEIIVGKLGTFSFPQGWYIYVGSARRNIRSRIERHLQREKKLRWHFDYLRPFLQVEKVQTFDGNIGECGLFHNLLLEKQGKIIIKGFGSSDCKCQSHLIFSGDSLTVGKHLCQ
ncbi:MAG TPA: DUF123 domain-containing protein [Paenibacillaceae bacterium]|nr:DUF123 domain-containing protein [Paenibacillaceae bacterium]